MRAIQRWANALGVLGIPLLVALWLCARVLLGANPPFVATESSAMEPTVRSGDLVVLHGVAAGDVSVGDVVAVHDHDGNVILRRVVSRDQQGSFFAYDLRADNRPTAERTTVVDDDIVGRGGAQLPLVGWLVLVARSAEGVVALATAWVLAVALRLTRRPDPAEHRASLPYGGRDRSEGPDATKMGSAMSITPADLRHLRFAQVRRGYDTEAVDRVLERVADRVEELLHERQELLDRVRVLEADVERMRESEEAITRTLQLAERAAEELKAEARVEAERLLDDARRRGSSALPDPAFVELLGETRAIRSLLQTLLTQGDGEPPFTPRQQ